MERGAECVSYRAAEFTKNTVRVQQARYPQSKVRPSWRVRSRRPGLPRPMRRISSTPTIKNAGMPARR
jgi:hypothetical protein